MKIIKPAKRVRVERYSYVYLSQPDDGTHHGYAFPCTRDGKIHMGELKPSALENLRKCQTGVYNVSDEGVRDESYTYREDPVGKCSTCGKEVVLYNAMTNECSCGALYNGSGQDLAPRNQWREGYDDYSDIGMY